MEWERNATDAMFGLQHAWCREMGRDTEREAAVEGQYNNNLVENVGIMPATSIIHTYFSLVTCWRIVIVVTKSLSCISRKDVPGQ